MNETKCAIQNICSRAEQTQESSSNVEDRNRKVVPSHLTIKIKKKGESLQELLISVRGANI